MNDTKKKNAIAINIKFKSIKKFKIKYFSTAYLNHNLEYSCLENHRNELIKLVIKKYLIIRLNHISVTKNDSTKRIRSLHSRMVIFKNQ